MAVDKGDIQITMGVNTTSYNSELDEAKKKAAKTGKQIKDNLQKAGKGFQSMNKFGGKFGGVLKNITEGITGLLSPIGLVMAAIAGLGTLAVKVWDKMTESAQQFKERMQTMSGILSKQTAQLNKAQKQQEQYIQILAQMASKQKLSISEKMLAIRIIEELTKRYGDLGISINQTTGKIENFDKALAKMNVKKDIKKTAALIKEKANAEKNAHWQASAMISEISNYKDIKYDRDKYKSLEDARNMGFDVKFSPTHDLKYFAGSGRAPGAWHEIEISDEQKKLRKLWNEGGLKEKREFARQMIDRSAGDDDRVKMFKDLYDALDQYMKKDAQYNAYEKYGTTDPNELINLYNKIDREINTKIQQREANTDKWNKDRQKRKQDFQFKNLKTDQQKISVLQKRLNEQKSTGNEFEKTDSELQKKSAQLAKKLLELHEKRKKQQKDANVTTVERLETEKESIETLKEYGKVQEEIAKNNQTMHDSYSKQLQLELQIKELKQKSANYYKDSLGALNSEIQITKLKIKGLNEEAEKQQLINELKAKGLMIDEAEVDKILAKRRQLVKLNKQLESKDNQYSVSGKSLQDKIQQKINPFNYEYKKRLEEQKAKKGEALTKKQRSQIRKVVELQFKASDIMNRKPDLSDFQTFTNELASRGGFSSSVVSASKNDVNERIYKVQKQTQMQLKNILAEMKRMGVIG